MPVKPPPERPPGGVMLIDSDVLVWMTRGHVGAVQRLAQLLPWQLSAVTYIELAQGCRSKAELSLIRKGLALTLR